MRTALLVTYHFPPSAASGTFRLLGFARHLPRFGWRCVVVAPPRLPWEPTDQSLLGQVPAETVRCEVPYPSGLPKAVRWLAPWAVWLPYARAAARRATVEHRPDVVLTSGPPHWVHLLGRDLQKRYGLPWVADFRDPWISGWFGAPPRGWQARWEGWWERRVFRHADLVLANAPHFAGCVQKAYPEIAGKIRSLTNGYDPESFPARPSAPRPQGAAVRLLHAGQLYVGRDPRPLLDAIAAVPAGLVPPFRLEFLGRTEYQKGADVAADARQRHVEDRVLCRGQMGYRESLEEMCSADVLVLMDTPGRKIGVPAKLYEYLGAGRPILATGEEDGDLAAILQQSGVPHRIVPPGDVGRIRAAIIELLQGVVTGAYAADNNERRLRFSRQSLAGELAEMLHGVGRKPA